MSESNKTNNTIWLVHDVIECPSCGLVQQYPEIRHGELTACHRCGRELFRHPVTKEWSVSFAFAISSLILYLMMISFPLLSINIYGRTNTLGVFNGTIEFIHQGWGSVGLLVGAAIVVFPIITISLMIAILSYALRKELPNFFPKLLHIYKVIRPWSMVEVYILGIFVAYTKLISMAHVELDYSLYAVILLMISMSVTDACVDFAALWARCPIKSVTMTDQERELQIKKYQSAQFPDNDHVISCECCQLVFVTEQPVGYEDSVATCPRCGTMLHKRKVNSINRSLALLVAAFIFYIPANLYPIMSMTMMGKESSHRIFGGVVELWQSHMVPLALLVFVASIAVPVLKISGIAMMIGASLMRSKRWLIARSKAFQVISFIGRWSMIDVFMISILIALIKFEALANVQANAGIVMFAAVVVLTIFAADVFDPRLMWDHAGMNEGVKPQSNQELK
ncbi:paraquat-inducible protein A [Commensalibacter oyaizuii]|uniref:Paraquat-inducible protein A n=1 Tax=Commensalibacter oyaizuii TaxID=3043873 RepID=A0ABT6Q1K4_9PROT|nr:paraquat-inducible protein A [Commensalibacter sp. TBRC 16381]MDI2090996.1 paraquat-inducible protein A [Commensalibacter sp. TBRC 16381]